MVCGNNPSAIVLLSQMTQVSRWGQGIHEWQVFMATWQNFTDDARRHVISGSVFLVLYCLQAPCFVGRNTVRILFYTKKKNLRFCGCKKNQREKKHQQQTSPMFRRAAAQQLGCNSLVLLYFSPGNENPSSPKGDSWHHSTPRVAHAEPPKHQCVLS